MLPPFGVNPFVRQEPEPMADPFDRKAVELVKGWLRPMMQGKLFIDERDAPIVQMNSATCTALAIDIAAALREAAEGRLR